MPITETTNSTGQKTLFDYQCDQLLRELQVILDQKWPYANRDGADLIRQIFDKYSELFDTNIGEVDDEDDEALSDLEPGSLSHQKLLGK